ncbi:MAG: ATP-binding protein, partial [Candidatus Omnitrophota bacterium]
AKFIFCSQRTDDDCCDRCPSCLRIDKGVHPDCSLLGGDGPAAIKIGDIRDIEKRSGLRPYEGRYKVFIIDGAEDMNDCAANGFLKTLEEPRGDTVFILITPNEQMLLPTVVSRCRRVRFNGLGISLLRDILASDGRFGPQRAHFAAYFSQGALSSALAIKDDKSFERKNAVWDNLSLRQVSFKDREDARRQLNLLLLWLRDIVYARAGLCGDKLINAERQDEICKCKEDWPPQRLEMGIAFIAEALSYLHQNINLNLLANLVKVKLCKG